jgi:ABC-type transporter Mla MlaB component
VKKGKEGGEAAWLLSLELMQWQHQQAAFDDRAVEFAVTFELSPPSWEPPPLPPSAETAPAAAPPADEAPVATRDAQSLVWSGTLTGSTGLQLTELANAAVLRNVIAIDMSAVDRIDFVCAGAMLNTITRVEGQRKSVQIAGASPIIRALLLLIGISPRHFVRKST